MNDKNICITTGVFCSILFLLTNISSIKSRLDFYLFSFGFLGILFIPSIIGIFYYYKKNKNREVDNSW